MASSKLSCALALPAQALAAMVQLEVPHVSVLTKVDLLQDKVRGGAAPFDARGR